MSHPINQRIRVELHVHTRLSKDSLADPEKILARCETLGIDRIAITDHNEIDAGLALHARAPERVIVGEEVETTQGELLGYFMSERVPGGLDPLEAIARLKAQGAVISVPHPLDTPRSTHWEVEELEKIVPYVDAIEVFNARCLSNIYNQRAQTFAKKNGLLQTGGSDAHSLWELGRATMLMPQFDDPESFKEALWESDIDGKRSSPLVHFFSRYAVFVKHLRSLTN